MEKLNDEKLNNASGGVTDEEFQKLEVGTRIHVDSGLHEGQCGIILEFHDYFDRPGYHRSIVVKLDSGKTDLLTPKEFSVL